MEAATPNDASVKFGLYQIERQLKDGTKALNYLTQAVALDPIYGLEYPQLATVAMEKGQSEQAVKMLSHAAAAMPENPFISLQLAGHLNQLGHPEQALKLLTQLEGLSWSKTYFPDMQLQLEALKKTAGEKKTDP